MWHVWSDSGCASILSRNSPSPLFSAARRRALHRETKKLVLAALHLVPAQEGAGPIVSVRSTAIEVAMVATRSNRKDLEMAIIGEFITNGNAIVGNVRTLTVSMKARL